MSEELKPNIGRSLILVHKVITRGLMMTIERSEYFARQGYPDAATRDGFADYVRSLATFLDAHHGMEDELAFPYLRDKTPEAPFDRLTRQHRGMIPLLGRMKAAVEGTHREQAGASLRELSDAATRAQRIWQPHIRTEEEHFAPERLAALISVEEHMRLNGMFTKYSQEHATPDYLVVPFTLFNLSPEERALMAQGMPPVVIQQLVPVVWKEKWQAMAPFLLT
jgi:hemerythrin-like domain-containing protein